MPAEDTDFAPLKRRLSALRYLLIADPTWFADAQGGIWLDASWARDLRRHLDYITNLTILAPRADLPEDRPEGMERIDLPGLRFVALPTGRSAREALARFPRMAATIIREVRRADVVHSGAAGWPIPPGLVTNPTAVILRKPLVIVIESAFWRGDGGPRSRKARLSGWLTERLARWSVRRAALSVFTHRHYAEELARDARGEVLVTPASWIDEAEIRSEANVRADWDRRGPAPRYLLAARLVEPKGIRVALAAMERAEAAGEAIEMDVIGTGPLADSVSDLAARLRTARLRLLDPVPYGAPFFALLRAYHAVIVPSLSDEQPRILYDAFAQGLAALASDTTGHREAVIPGETGLRLPVGDADALRRAMRDTEATALRDMGFAARRLATSRTHRAMHLQRARALARILGDQASEASR